MIQQQAPDYDVLILGGGPAGSTLGSLLKKYRPKLSVLIVEKEKFPRDHVGESQLPGVSAVLHEMGCWDKVEAANFPVKIGASYTWGATTTPWDFEFVPLDRVPEKVERPAKYDGYRLQTAFQVDRAVYDEILLNHAEALGCEVLQETRADQIEREGDRVLSVTLSSGRTVTARWYVDATGAAATLRRKMDVNVTAPTLLQNVAFYQYWNCEEWAKTTDIGATRVHVRSLPYGWLWFIPLSATRTSIGLVTPAKHYKASGLSPAELYHKALQEEPYVSKLITSAEPESEKVETTTDWSFVVDRTYGENWFLCGETAGFADPILAAGLTLTQTGAKELAYTLIELDIGEHDADWLISRYDELQRNRVRQHHRFAEYWYSANGIFEDIRENCAEIAKDAGLELNPDQAFRWLSTGGFADDTPGMVGVGGFDISSLKHTMQWLTGETANWQISGKNVFRLNLKGATKTTVAHLENGRIRAVPCYVRGGKKLAIAGLQAYVIEAMRKHSTVDQIFKHVRSSFSGSTGAQSIDNTLLQVLEALTAERWVQASVKKGKPVLIIDPEEKNGFICKHREDRLRRPEASAFETPNVDLPAVDGAHPVQ
jgi:flavin-dependent dehydrogenase